MARRETGRGFETFLPDVELKAASTRVKRGEPTTLSWTVTKAEEARLWRSAALPEAPEPLDWPSVGELGDTIRLSDTMEVAPSATTAFYLVATGVRGIRGRRIVVEVSDERAEPAPAPETWGPLQAFLPRMEDAAHVGRTRRLGRIGTVLPLAPPSAEEWHAGPTPPGISLSASSEVMFDDESSTLAWSISNGTCAEMGMRLTATNMAADLTKITGTKFSGSTWGASGMPPCGLPLTGNEKLTGQGVFASCDRLFGITAHNLTSAPAVAWRWVDSLSIPQFTGSSAPSRISDIRSALKTNDALLRNGCIYNDSALDAAVAAFKNGQLKRTELWSRLLDELENIRLDTFECTDVADADWGAGHWEDYTNKIVLEWSPSHTPYLEYVILHELVHKCGFNGELLKFYSKADIENQAHAVSGACYP